MLTDKLHRQNLKCNSYPTLDSKKIQASRPRRCEKVIREAERACSERATRKLMDDEQWTN